ncbi:MAG TPA: hypothetical protein VJJ83_05355 [Candidatus Babeliales bacterium]|nr:MAG: hypothetical protein A3F67_01045 [Verrucomicrobia bacterium RIFCSPHIGHO2_12_FULL_41_10]HLB41192.1 hypothetical protein [Candidatus Babeliales bacterium]
MSQFQQFLIAACLLISQSSSLAKILIITPVYNRPDFIEMQDRTFKRFLKDEYIFRVFNDASDPKMQQQIEQTCANLGIECTRMPQELHNVDPMCKKAPASFRHGEVVQYAFETVGFKHDDIVMLIDSDIFLIHDFSVRQFFQDYDLYTVFNFTVLPQLAFFNMPKLPHPEKLNFHAGYQNNNLTDVGHRTIEYTRAYPELKLKISNLLWGLERMNLNEKADLTPQLAQRGFTVDEINLIKAIFKLGRSTKNMFDADISFFEHNIFLDYKHGTGWHGASAKVIKQKNILIRDFIDKVTNS